MVQRIEFELPNTIRILVDTDLAKRYIQRWNPTARAWETIHQWNLPQGSIETDYRILKPNPALVLAGTETGAISAHLQESAGAVILRDLTNAINLLRLAGNTPLQYETVIPVVSETPRTGLDASSVDVKWESIDILIPTPEMMRYASAAIEATWTATATDSVSAIELYDVTAASVRASVSGNAGTNVKSSYVSLVPGNVHRVRARTATASALTGQTWNLTKCLIYLRFSPI